jgi:hypothetical protein
MSESRRISEIYVDVDTPQLVDVNNSVLRSFVTVFRRSQVLFQCHLRKADGTTAFTPPTNAEWVFIIDDSYDPTHSDYVVSDNAQFNITADWADLDVANGKICWRVDTTTTQLTAAMGSDSSKNMVGELWMLPNGGEPSLIVQMTIVIKNIVGDVGADTGLVFTPSNVIKFDGDDVVLYFPDGSVAQRWSKV